MSSFNSKDLLELAPSELLLDLMALTQGGITVTFGVQNVNCRQVLLSGSLGVDEPLTSEPWHYGEATSRNHNLSCLLHVKTNLS